MRKADRADVCEIRGVVAVALGFSERRRASVAAGKTKVWSEVVVAAVPPYDDEWCCGVVGGRVSVLGEAG